MFLPLRPRSVLLRSCRRLASGMQSPLNGFCRIQKIQTGIQHKVLIVDEAGMISGRQMWELLHLTEQNSARIVFSGDTHQIQSVEACDALRILEKESRLKSTSLTQVQRQTVSSYREAIQELRRNPERGFAKLDEIGAVREIPFLDRPQAIARGLYGVKTAECIGGLRNPRGN